MNQLRPEVAALLELAPLPSERTAEVPELERVERALLAIPEPITREEAIALATAFGPDGCFGLAWVLVHLIEGAIGGPPLDDIPPTDNEWVLMLRQRFERYQRLTGRTSDPDRK